MNTSLKQLSEDYQRIEQAILYLEDHYKNQHNPGQVEIVFDGAAREVVCPMVRTVKCSKELKNPFDPCPE